MGMLIGKGGSGLREMQDKTGVKVGRRNGHTSANELQAFF